MYVKKLLSLLFVFCVATVLFAMTGCGAGKTKENATAEPNSQVTYVKGADFVGVVREINKEDKTVTLYNTSFEGTEEYSYFGATEIRSKNERDMVMDEVSVGEAYEIYTTDDGKRIQKMVESSDIIVAEEAEVSVDSEQKRLTVQGVTYAYTDNMVAFSGSDFIDPLEITKGDLVTFRGVKGQAYSLVVTRGHGYIKPEKYKDLVGGKLIIHGEAILPVSEDMLLTLPEGKQRITMAYQDVTATTEVYVRRGETTTVDMSRYMEQSPDIAHVKFVIEPEGAELYINGSEVNYEKPVKLRYGSHSVQVVLDGYNDYSGVLNVKEANPTVTINLSQQTAEVESDEDSDGTDSDDTTDDGETDTDDSGSSATSTATSSTDYDTDHTITVSEPSGAAVYINGTYKGEAPCSFTKMLGDITLTLKKDGYTTKSYQIEISDDSQDISWSFPELTKEGEG